MKLYQERENGIRMFHFKGRMPSESTKSLTTRAYELSGREQSPLTTAHLLRAFVELENGLFRRLLKDPDTVTVKLLDMFQPSNELPERAETLYRPSANDAPSPNMEEVIRTVCRIAEDCVNEYGEDEITPAHLFLATLVVPRTAGRGMLESVLEDGELELMRCMLIVIIRDGYEGTVAELETIMSTTAYKWVLELDGELTSKMSAV